MAAGGKIPVVSARPETITARQLFDHYLKTHGNGTIEASSLKTAKTHLNQVAETLGERFRIQSLTVLNLQEHVERRRKKGVAAVTLKKEMATLRACWNWAAHGELVKGVFPGRGLRFPKEEEKEPFRTFAEIEAIIAAEKPDDDRKAAFWEALYLTRPEMEEFLAHVRQNGTLPWVYPMIVFAAYTGARPERDAPSPGLRRRPGRRDDHDPREEAGSGQAFDPDCPASPRSWPRPCGNGSPCGRTARPSSARRSGSPGAGRGVTGRRRSPRTRPTTISSGRWLARSGRRCGATMSSGTRSCSRPGERGRGPAGDRRNRGSPVGRAAASLPAPLPEDHEGRHQPGVRVRRRPTKRASSADFGRYSGCLGWPSLVRPRASGCTPKSASHPRTARSCPMCSP